MNFGGHFTDLIEPTKIHSLSVSILLDRLEDTRGGIGANIAFNLALLGDRPNLLGSAGQTAKNYMAELEKLGVDVSHVHYSHLPTASFNVITDGGDRQVGGFYPGAMSDSDGLKLSPWKDKEPFVIVAPHDPKGMRRQVEECRQYGFRLFYDVSQQVTNISSEDIKAGLEVAELLIVNDYELSVIARKTKRSPEAIKSQMPVVITTLGSEGSVIEGKKTTGPIKVGIVRPDRVVDPTGAGDAYRAGFVHGYVRGWDLKRAAQLGATCAAYALEKAGTQSHSFTFSEVANRYKHTFGEELSDGYN